MGVSRARMVVSGSVSEFSDCIKNEVEQTFVFCAAPEALTVPPALALVPVTLLVFALAREATTSSFSHSFISTFFSNFQSPMFPSMSFFQSPSPASASFPACFECGVAVPAIAALAVATSVCRESQRTRVIMLSDPGPGLERISIVAPSWWRFCDALQAKIFEGMLTLAYGCQTCLPSLFLFRLSRNSHRTPTTVLQTC